MKRDFKEEDRRIKRFRKEGYREDFIKSWLRKWREVGERYGLVE